MAEHTGDFHVGDTVANRRSGAVLTVTPLGSWSAGHYELVSCEHTTEMTPAIPGEMIEAVARNMYRRYESDYEADHLTWRDFADDARADLAAALAGRTVVELPASVDGVFRPSARTLVAKVDDEGRPFVRIDGQIWLDSEAEDVGLAMVAAARHARQLAAESSGAGRCPRCDSPAPNLHPAVQLEGEVQICPHPWHEASGDGESRG